MLFCEASEKSLQLIAGVDEAGRGPLAGNVVAAAVILDPAVKIEGLRDSKKLSETKRQLLAAEIKQSALAYAIGEADVAEIDQIKILQASMLAMSRAVSGLGISPDFVYVDGNRCPLWDYQSRAVVKGDDRICAVAAASILAKVYRDGCLVILSEKYPEYGFAKHKGYPTAEHLRNLQKFGASPIHRMSFAPVKAVLSSK